MNLTHLPGRSPFAFAKWRNGDFDKIRPYVQDNELTYRNANCAWRGRAIG